MIFPKRFEMEGLNTDELEVKLVCLDENGKVCQETYENLAELNEYYDISVAGWNGPMADKNRKGEWCIRFETDEVNAKMSV